MIEPKFAQHIRSLNDMPPPPKHLLKKLPLSHHANSRQCVPHTLVLCSMLTSSRQPKLFCSSHLPRRAAVDDDRVRRPPFVVVQGADVVLLSPPSIPPSAVSRRRSVYPRPHPPAACTIVRVDDGATSGRELDRCCRCSDECHERIADFYPRPSISTLSFVISFAFSHAAFAFSICACGSVVPPRVSWDKCRSTMRDDGSRPDLNIAAGAGERSRAPLRQASQKLRRRSPHHRCGTALPST